MKKHFAFESRFQKEIKEGTLTLCPSMPSIEYWFLLHFTDYSKLLKDYGAAANKLAHHLKPYFPDPNVPLKKLLKMEKYLKDSSWVEKLCADGKLELAVERAERNIQRAQADVDLENQSYSFVYMAFK